MSNLLKDASILLTPTAYENGRMNAIKPVYSEVEKFSNIFNTLESGWSYNNNILTGVNTPNNAISIFNINANFKFKVSFEVSNLTGILFFKVNNTSLSNAVTLSNGIYEYEGVVTGANPEIKFDGAGSSPFSGNITNISIKETTDADFNFERNSAATRVNAQGLVENVQIISPELVSNGNFSEIGTEEVLNGNFLQEGSELITNGDFSNEYVGWGLSGNPSNYSVEVVDYDGKTNALHFTTPDNNSGVNQIILQSNKPYLVKFDLKVISGNVYVGKSSNKVTGGLLNPSEWTTYEEYWTSSDDYFRVYSSGSAEFYLDNVSVKEVGQNWTLGTGWSIGDGVAYSDNTQTNYESLQQSSVTTIGKTYELKFNLNLDSGVIQAKGNAVYETYYPADNGEVVSYFVADSTSFRFTSFPNNTLGSITNISVKEVGQDWTIGTGWSVDQANSKATSDGVQSVSYLRQNNIVNLTSLYRIKFTVSNSTSGTLKYIKGNSGVATSVTNNGEYSFEATWDGSSPDLVFQSLNFNGSITNISVKEITDDTNIPRINYEGFDYQDSLGSEWFDSSNITDRDNATNTINSDNTITTELNSSIQGWSINASSIFNQNKKYKVEWEVLSTNSTTGTFWWWNGVEQGGFGDLTQVGSGVYYIEGNASGTNADLRFQSAQPNSTVTWSVSVKEYLGQEVVPDSGCGSWLLENQSTNLVTYSEDFSNAAWSKLNSIITPNQGISPNGGNNASKYVGSTTSQDLRININVTSNYTYSFYVKAINSPFIRLRTTDGSCWFNMTTNAVATNVDFADAEIKSVGNDWYRISVTSSSFTSSNNFYIHPHATDSTTVELNGAEFLLWGAQVEEQSYSTSYIPTNGATNTRLQDIANNSGNFSLINSTEGVLYAEIAALANDGTNRVISLSDDTNSHRALISYSSQANKIQAYYNNGISTPVDFLFTDTNLIAFNKLAFKYKENDFALWVNGAEVATSSTGGINAANTFNNLKFENASGSSDFYGKNKALAVYKEALTDASLRCLTYPNPVATTFDLDFDTIAEQFTFTRGSEATFVNSQGLIESTNQLGSEEITNGDFSNGISNWIQFIPATFENSSVIFANNSKIAQYNVGAVNKKYNIVIDFSDISGNGLTILVGNSNTFIDFSVSDIVNNGNKINFNRTFLGTNHLFIYSKSSSTSATITNVSVKEVITATNTPRLDYSTGEEAFLLEPQSTNLVTYSSDLSSSIYIKSNVTFTGQTTTAPDGSQAEFLTVNGYIFLNASSIGGTAPSTTRTFSFYVKAQSEGYQISYRAPNSVVTTIDVSSTEWTRVVATGTNNENNLMLQDNRTLSSVGNVAFWGVQFENESYATSYIPTDGASATRNQEVCKDATPVINSEEGTFYAEISALGDSGTNRYITLSDGTANNSVRIYLNSNGTQLSGQLRSGGGLQCLFDHTVSDLLDFNKIAFSYKQNDFSFWINGTEIDTDTSGNTPIGLSKLSFDRGDGTQSFYGNTKDLKYYPKALQDVQLEALTSFGSFTEMANALNYTII